MPKHYKDGPLRIKKQIHAFIKIFSWRSMSFACQDQREATQSKLVELVCDLGEVGGNLASVAHRAGGAVHWGGAAHWDGVAHWVCGAVHTPEGPNLFEISPNCSSIAWIFQVGSLSWYFIQFCDKLWWFMDDNDWKKILKPYLQSTSKGKLLWVSKSVFCYQSHSYFPFLPCFYHSLISYPPKLISSFS